MVIGLFLSMFSILAGILIGFAFEMDGFHAFLLSLYTLSAFLTCMILGIICLENYKKL